MDFYPEVFSASMSFPDSDRVLYRKNPLDQVICQLRFPDILRVNTQTPMEFQEIIRNEYPLFEVKSGANLLSQGIMEQLPAPVTDALLKIEPVNAYEFSSADGLWIVSLTRNFLALTSRKYERWEDFKNHLESPIEALVKVYSPAFYTRIGLRYVDVIRRSTLGLQDTPWSRLLQPYIAGELSTNIENLIEEMGSQTIIKLDDGRVKLQSGFVQASDNNETCYLLDSDFFTEQQTETKNAIGVLDSFNQQSRRLFHWCITEQLHQAMEPEPIS